MKIHMSLIVLGLLQMGMPTGYAQDEKTYLRRGSAEDDASDGVERELRPFGYPASQPRPGQTRKYGLNSLVGFRPYNSGNQYVVTNTQPILPTIETVDPDTAPGSLVFRPGPTAPADDAPGSERGSLLFPSTPPPAPPGRPNRPIGGKSGKAAKSSKGFARAQPNRGFATDQLPMRQNGEFDGNFVVGVPRTGSLAEALGFYRVEQGSQVVFVEDENDDTVVPSAEPTGTPAPTVSPMPTATPTRSPTSAPTASPTPEPSARPTRSPTFNPTRSPTRSPTASPTRSPTRSPTANPTRNPTANPTAAP